MLLLKLRSRYSSALVDKVPDTGAPDQNVLDGCGASLLVPRLSWATKAAVVCTFVDGTDALTATPDVLPGSILSPPNIVLASLTGRLSVHASRHRWTVPGVAAHASEQIAVDESSELLSTMALFCRRRCTRFLIATRMLNRCRQVSAHGLAANTAPPLEMEPTT
jgi:hypothetical protein